MILEIAEITAAPGQADALAAGIARGAMVIRQAEGCQSVQFAQSVEEPQQFVLLVRWRTIEDHLVTFRNGPLFGQWRQEIAGLFVGQPHVLHYPTSD